MQGNIKTIHLNPGGGVSGRVRYSDMASTIALEIPRSAPSYHLVWWPQVLLLAVTLVLAIIDAIWLRMSGVKLILGDMKIVIPIGLFFAGIGFIYAILRPEPRLALPVLSIAQFLLFLAPGCIFSYATMTIGRPLVDPFLAAFDARLGFDWIDYVAFMRESAWVSTILRWSYTSFFFQIIFLCCVLSVSRRYAAVNELLANILIGGLITCTIGAFYPALGGYHHFNIPDHGVSAFIPAIENCRTGQLSIIDMDKIQGLIMFPSYHAQMSIAFILAAWSLPLIRYPFLVLNVVVLLSTPVFGAHYLTDVIGGSALVVVFSIGWRKLQSWLALRDVSMGL